MVNFYFIPRWRHVEKIQFITEILNWQKGSEILHGLRCMIINFGYKENFPYAEIKLSLALESNFKLNVGSFGFKSPNKCSVVVIGGKLLKQVDKVMRMVDKITDDIAWMPSAVFLMAEKPGQDIKFTVSTSTGGHQPCTKCQPAGAQWSSL